MIRQFKSVLTKLSLRMTALILICSFTGMLCSCAKDNSDFDGVRFSKTRKITVLADFWTDKETDLNVVGNGDDPCAYRVRF